MAVTIPTVREQSIRQSPMVQGRQQVDAPADAFGAGIGRALSRAGDEMERTGFQLNRSAEESQNETNALRVMELDNQAQREVMDFLYSPETGLYNRKGGNALNVKQEAQAKMQEIRQRYMAVGDNQQVKTMMTERLLRLENSTLDQTTRYSLQEYQGWKNDTLKSRVTMNNEAASLAWNNENEFQSRLASNRALQLDLAKQEGWSDETLNANVRAMESGMIQDRVAMAVNSKDPSAIMMAKNYYDKMNSAGRISFNSAIKIDGLLSEAVPTAAAQATFKTGRAAWTERQQIIDSVIDQNEGGDQIAQEPGGGIAKFGINSKAFPNVDVANLKREQAVEIYNKEFYDKYGVDEVNPNMRLIAFDTVMNHRTEFAKEMMEKIRNGATKDEILSLRLKEYQRLATADPEKYGNYYEGWKGRLQRVDAMTGAGWDTKTIYPAADELEKKYKGAGKELIGLYENQQKEKARAETLFKNDVTDKVQKIMTESNGDYTKIPPNLRADARSVGIDVTKMAAFADPVINREVKNELDAMSGEELFGVDLNSERYAAGLSFEQKQGYLQKQADYAKPENKVMQDMVDSVTNYYFRSQTGKNPDDKNQKAAVADMKNYINFQVGLLREKGTPTKADVNKIASEYLAIKKESDVKSVRDIPAAERAVIENNIIQGGGIPSEAAVLAVYRRMRATEKTQASGSSGSMATAFSFR